MELREEAGDSVLGLAGGTGRCIFFLRSGLGEGTGLGDAAGFCRAALLGLGLGGGGDGFFDSSGLGGTAPSLC